MSLPDVLKLTRQKVFMTQEDFANESQVSVATINRWENGKVKPNLSAMKKIKQFCDNNNLSFEVIEKAWFDKTLDG
jgi:predicted transcriptional regulator